MNAIDFIVGMGITPPPQIKDPSERWHARFYDPRDGSFYAGNGSTAWEAVAWALDEMVHRRAGIVRTAMVPGAMPTATPNEKAIAVEMARAKEPMRLPLAATTCTKTKSAAARRSRVKKTK